MTNGGERASARRHDVYSASVLLQVSLLLIRARYIEGRRQGRAVTRGRGCATHPRKRTEAHRASSGERDGMFPHKLVIRIDARSFSTFCFSRLNPLR